MNKEVKGSKKPKTIKEKVVKVVTEKVKEVLEMSTESVNESVENKITTEKVGDLIREARLGKKIAVEEVGKSLCIRKVYLEAIENSDYEELPEFPYGVGFVRSYADFLGLNGSRLADLFKSEMNFKESADKKVVDQDMDAETIVPNSKYIILSIIAVALIYFAWLFINSYYNDVDEVYSKGETSEIEQDSTDFPLQIEDFTTQDSDFSETGEAVTIVNEVASNDDAQIKIEEGTYFVEDTENTLESNATLEKGIVIKVIDDTWFEAKDSSKLYVSKEFSAGSSYVVPDKLGMIISVGRPNAVEVYIDGEKIEDVFTARKKTNIILDRFLDKRRH